MRRLLVPGAVLLVSIAVAAAPAPPASQPGTAKGRPLAIEDYYRLQSVGSPTISPGGSWVLFTISARIEEDNSTATSTWVVASDGSSSPQRILHFGRDVTGARWTGDDQVEYSAERERWRIDPRKPLDQPERVAARVRGRPGGDEALRGSQRGRKHREPWMGGGWRVARQGRAAGRRSMSEFRRAREPLKGAIFDWKDFQRDGQPFPAPDPRARPAAEIVVTPAGGGQGRVLTNLDVRPSGLTWHPDSTRLLFIADTDWRDELEYGSPDLWIVTLAGRITRLTDDGHVYSNAGFSPDGKYISYVRSPGTDLIIQEKRNHGGPTDLYVMPVAGGKPVNLPSSWDLDPGRPQWSPDSRFIYFTAGIGGETHLFRVAVPNGNVEQVTKGPRRLNGVTFDKAFTKIAYTVGVHDRPPDVYVANIDGSNERRLTDVNRALMSEVATSPAERLQWKSHDGTPIEGWLIFPYGYDAKKGPYPLIVTSHGGPHSATGYSFDFKKQFFAANGYFVLDTNFRSSTGYGEAFKWATWGEWGRKDGEDVVSGIDHVLERYPIDPKRVGHTGHSYGGFMTNWLITQYPDRFAAAISGAGISNWISDYGTADIYRTKETEFYGPPWDAAARERMIKQSPLTWAGNVKTPTLFVHGEQDQRVPYEEGEQMYFALKRRGVPAKMIQYAGQPHASEATGTTFTGCSTSWNGGTAT